MTPEHEAGFDELIHSPVRLRICGLLRRVDELEFGALRDLLGVQDAHLSKNLKALGDAGYVAVRKERSPERSDARRLTWASLTPAGRAAFDAHVAALTRIAAGEPAG
ncbi:transcriptional regulator [Agromyces seonyuensis]|uniref:Helix-turn-helix domain-containing protein n=1 Tax=Agromyces seonyuensis TaxID=2662446 RepID=A0A6I4NXT4_9MICO|nr:transcriptional regulator [Agromyces seonyuensis]MWB98991.1 helix-turn-helix domain-containing protein [Agromyces seonyuensis]